MICGDFKMDRGAVNCLTKMLGEKKFKQIIQKPTTYRGNCIDHFYHNISEAAKKIEYNLHCPYYSDHGALCITIKDA